MRKNKFTNQFGYSLFELVVVMIIISILMTVSMRYMGNSIDAAKTEETKQELNQLAHSIVGNEVLVSGNHRTDYGYVGDIGALPSSLNNLVTNPGLATWNGPYVNDDFYASSGSTESEYLIDGWGKTYAYTGSINISSSGGPTTITKELANSTNDILNNSVSFNIVDIDFCPPGIVNKDSILFNLTYPNGTGSYQTDSKFPSAGGFVSFSSIPIGQQTLSVVEMKNNDTLTKIINVNLNSSSHDNIQLPNSLWCDLTPLGNGGNNCTGSGIIVLRPNGAGAFTQLTDYGCILNWECVDDITSDETSTVVYTTSSSYRTDTYSIENPPTSNCTITKVVVYNRSRKITIFINGYTKSVLSVNGVNYEGPQTLVSSLFNNYSNEWLTNPSNSSAWTWADIQNLEIGVSSQTNSWFFGVDCTQIWIEVFYSN